MARNEISRRTFIKGLVASAAIIATLGVLQKVEYSIDSGNAPGVGTGGASSETSPISVSGMSYTPGTYTASAKGFKSDVTVTMTFDEASITDIQIDASGETPDIGGKIVDEMREKILAAQSCNVDGISGATITADAIKAAAADCISQACGRTMTFARHAAKLMAKL